MSADHNSSRPGVGIILAAAPAVFRGLDRRRLRRSSAWLSIAALGIGLASCGSGSSEPHRTTERASSEALDAKVEATNRSLQRAARAGDGPALARAESDLTRLTRQRDAAEPQTVPPAKDPFERELDRFKFTQAPLFVQQITSSEGDHILFASVYRPQFCLKPPDQRLGDVREVYVPMSRRLRAVGVPDFELIVVPMRSTNPSRADALAIGRGARLSLTRRGRSC
jgi:hypothetical protein